MPEPIESFSARGAELMLTSAFRTGATDDAQGWFHTNRVLGPQKGAGQDLRPSLRLSVKHGAISPNPLHAPAFLVCVRVRRERGPALSGAGLGSSGGVEGDIRILNLATNCDRDLDTAPEWLQFLLPRALLDRLSDENDWPVAYGLESGSTTIDPVMLRLAMMALRWIDLSPPPDDAFLDHLCFILCSHLMKHYARPDACPRRFVGGLAPWQQRRSIELMQARLSEGIDLAALATSCNLSVSHFARCFKQSLGVSAHRYLIRLRVEAAKERLATADSALSEIALECGFSDQAAFSRTFGSMVGSTPGRWRRQTAANADKRAPGLGAPRVEPGRAFAID